MTRHAPRVVVRRATAKRLREEGERALSNDEYDKGFALLSECMAPRLAEARHSISVDFDARVLYAIRMAKARQSKQREEREAHERRRAAIAKQEVLDRELARKREIELKYGATRRRREMATERLGRVFAVQEHAAAGGVISPTKGSAKNQCAYNTAEGPVNIAESTRGELNRRLLAPAMAAQSRDRISGRPDDAPGGFDPSSHDIQRPEPRQKPERPGSGGRTGMGRGVAAAGGGTASGSAAYDAAAAYLAERKKEGSWPPSK